jgi:hypothetical protein
MNRRLTLAAVCVGMVSAGASAQQDAGDEPPTLDELLGLEEGEKPAIPETTEEELQRKLSGEEAAESFREAARLMGEAAGRLNRAGDVGIDTQRLQEDIIRRLEMIIDSAPNQQRTSSSQSNSRQQQNEQQQPQQQPRDGQNQQAQGENTQEQTPPGLQEGQLGPAPALGSAQWGALPARVRDAISQGTSDEFSALYQGLTEAYYRRLAEEVNK